MKISVIICAYNEERHIDRCLESVVNQTIGLDMLEIVVVNDASTDGTLDKLYAWEKRFPDNILVVTYDENLRLGGRGTRGCSMPRGNTSDLWMRMIG